MNILAVIRKHIRRNPHNIVDSFLTNNRNLVSLNDDIGNTVRRKCFLLPAANCKTAIIKPYYSKCLSSHQGTRKICQLPKSPVKINRLTLRSRAFQQFIQKKNKLKIIPYRKLPWLHPKTICQPLPSIILCHPYLVSRGIRPKHQVFGYLLYNPAPVIPYHLPNITAGIAALIARGSHAKLPAAQKLRTAHRNISFIVIGSKKIICKNCKLSRRPDSRMLIRIKEIRKYTVICTGSASRS